MRVIHGFQHRLAGLELHPALVVIADFEGFSHFDDALQRSAQLGLPASGNQIEEGGFSAGIAPHDAYALIALEIVAEMAQIAFVFPPETHVPAVDHLVSQVGALYLRLAQVHLLLDVAVVGPLLDVPEGLFAVFGLAGAGAGARVHPLQFPAVEVPHPLGLGIVILYPFLALFQEVHIVSAVDVEVAAVQFHHGIAHPVQEIAVVGDHQQGAAAVFQVVFQELDGVQVQVVGGLVHDVEIGLGGQHLGKGHPLHLSAGKVLHGLLGFRQVKLRKKLFHTQFVLPKMVRVQLSGPGGRCVHDLPEDGFPGVEGVLLFQEGDADVLEEEHLAAAVGGVFPGQDAQQGGLARSVGGYQGHLVPFVDIEVNAAEQHFGTVALGEVFYLQVTGHGRIQMTPLPTISSSWYQTANWPGEMPRWGLSNRMYRPFSRLRSVALWRGWR